MLFADFLAETLFCIFFLFDTRRKKFGKTTSDYIISLEPIHVRKHFMTLFFLLYLHLLPDIWSPLHSFATIFTLQSEAWLQCKTSCSFSTVDSVCGPTPYAPNELHTIPLKSCRKDWKDYLTNLGVSGSPGFAGTRINEADVILNRAGFHLLSEEDRERITVCPKHRYELITHYQKLKSSCSHPSHRGEAKKLQNPRRVNKQV